MTSITKEFLESSVQKFKDSGIVKSLFDSAAANDTKLQLIDNQYIINLHFFKSDEKNI
jgi:hypothetical protein